MLLLNLKNKIKNLDLGKGATLNIESMKGNKIKKLERHGGSTVNFGDDISHKQEKKMLNKMVTSNKKEIK